MKAKAGSRRSSNAVGGAILAVRIQPRASKDGISRLEDGTFKIRLSAPPVDGAANEALIRFLSNALAVSRSSVEILSGQTARQKIIRITGMSDGEVQRVLNEAGK